MLMKYIEGYVYNDSKAYSYSDNFVKFDKHKSSLNLPNEYILNDIDMNISYTYNLFRNLINCRLYSSMSNVERAVRVGALFASLNITYCTDISKSDNAQFLYRDKVKTLDDLDRYCSGVRYEYNLQTKEIKRYEIYGDIILGDDIERPISYYAK